jgi:hypothetical protein
LIDPESPDYRRWLGEILEVPQELSNAEESSRLALKDGSAS